jgi:hypothetical protein
MPFRRQIYQANNPAITRLCVIKIAGCKIKIKAMQNASFRLHNKVRPVRGQAVGWRRWTM